MKNRTSQNTNFTMTQCTKGGVKIRDGNNSYTSDPFAGVNPFKSSDEIDVSEISMDEIQKLTGCM